MNYNQNMIDGAWKTVFGFGIDDELGLCDKCDLQYSMECLSNEQTGYDDVFLCEDCAA